jgi:enoyl-CoA hydratase/carnithine racemase
MPGFQHFSADRLGRTDAKGHLWRDLPITTKRRNELTISPKLTAAMTAVALGLATPVVAQQDQQQAQVPQIAADEVTDGQVDAFVKAALAVEEVRGIYLPQIQEAENEAARESLMDEANTEAMTAIEDVQGVSPRQYLAIARAAQSDETLNERINVELRSMRAR